MKDLYRPPRALPRSVTITKGASVGPTELALNLAAYLGMDRRTDPDRRQAEDPRREMHRTGSGRRTGVPDRRQQ